MEPIYFTTYFSIVIISMLTLKGVVREFEKKNPSLINRRWKRILWVISCLMFIPLFIMATKIPGFMLNEIREFIEGRKD